LNALKHRLATRRIGLWISILIFTAGITARCDETWLFAVQLTASVETNPSRITLNWLPDPYGALNHVVYRKGRDDQSWGWGTILSGNETNYTDTDVQPGVAYEYKVVRRSALGHYAYGYICSGIQVPETHFRGGIILLVAENLSVPLASEIQRLESDLTGDGWQVFRREVPTNATPEAAKSVIVSTCYQNPDVQALFLLGHIPVFHSGNVDYDGHQFRPMPSDAFYGDIDGDWSNSPDFIPSDVELMVGRVDLFNMPGNGSSSPWPSEIELIRNYLNKNHAWRQGDMNVPRRALMGDRRGIDDGYAPAASGYRAFDTLLGHGRTEIADTSDTAPPSQRWISRLAQERYLWAYGCGGGMQTGISHLGVRGTFFEVWSADVVDLDAGAVFVLLFGSWFGNWDGQDNFMRSFLATPTYGLACAMSGLPDWYLHHMALGEPIGYSARLSINNDTLYSSNTNEFNRANYVALMGDPTLRMHPFLPPSNLTAEWRNGMQLNWSPSPAEGVLGYHVYRRTDSGERFEQLTAVPVTETQFLDTTPSAEATYMVRAIREEQTPSGTFMNLSQGSFTSSAGAPPSEPIQLHCEPTPIGILLNWNAQPGQTYRLLVSEDLQGWFDFTGSIHANSSTVWWLDTEMDSDRRFYRVSSP